jgi:hypothetical protein
MSRVSAVDRDRARDNIRAGLLTASVAIFFFGMAFYVAVLYLA